jgi:hypothetical protein
MSTRKDHGDARFDDARTVRSGAANRSRPDLLSCVTSPCSNIVIA